MDFQNSAGTLDKDEEMINILEHCKMTNTYLKAKNGYT